MKNEIRVSATQGMEAGLLADIIYVFANWEHNWLSSDFDEAFKKSPMGSNWLWQKFEVCKQQPYTFYLCLDHKHQQMLVEYLYHVKYCGEIDSYRINRDIFENLTKGGE